MDIEQLIEQARAPARSSAAFGELVRRHQTMVYGVVYAVSGDWSEAQDLTQDAFVRAWQRLDGLRQPAQFAAWMRRIARSVALDARRARQSPVADDADNTPTALASPDAALASAQLGAAIDAEIEALPPAQRAAFVLHVVRGVALAEIAVWLELPIGTVKSHVSRARAALRVRLAETAMPSLTDIHLALEKRAMNTQLPADFAARVVRYIEASGAAWSWRPDFHDEGQTFGPPGRPDESRALIAEEPRLAGADIYAAAVVGDADAVRRLLEREPALANRAGGPRNWPPLLYLCFSQFLLDNPQRAAGAVDTARVLLAAGADANAFFSFDKWGNNGTCLYGAARVLRNLPLTEVLLEAGMKWDLIAYLYHAPTARDLPFLDRMLAHGAPTDGFSYLLRRMLDFENHATVAWFLAHGADPDDAHPTSGARETNLHWAIVRGRRPETVALLIEAGANVNAELARDATAWPPLRGRTSLALALRVGDAEVARQLRAAGAAEVTLDVAGQFVSACAHAEPVLARECLAALPGGFTTLDANDQQAITHVAQRGNTTGVRTMLEFGFNARARGWSNFSALAQASWMGHASTVELLLQRGARDDSERALSLTRWAFDAGYVNADGDYTAVMRMLQSA